LRSDVRWTSSSSSQSGTSPQSRHIIVSVPNGPPAGQDATLQA